MSSEAAWTDPDTGRTYLFGSHDQFMAFMSARIAKLDKENNVAPQVIRDELDYVKNPVDGKHYTSKRLYEKTVRQQGCQIVGNEAESQLEKAQTVNGAGPSGLIEDIKRVVGDA